MKCDVPYCKRESSFGYYGKGVCVVCFNKHCNDSNSFDLKKIFKIKDEKIDEDFNEMKIIKKEEIKKENWKDTFDVR